MSGDLRDKLDRQGEMIGKLQGERGQIATAVASTKAESDRKTKVFKELSDERDRFARELEQLTNAHSARENELNEEVHALANALADREAALRSWERRHGEEQESTNAALSGLETRILELEPLPSKLRSAEESLESWRKRYSELEVSSTREVDVLRERLTALEPLPEKVAALDADLEQARASKIEVEAKHDEERTALQAALALSLIHI